MSRKPIQLLKISKVKFSNGEDRAGLAALCDDGTIWLRLTSVGKWTESGKEEQRSGVWVELLSVPQD